MLVFGVGQKQLSGGGHISINFKHRPPQPGSFNLRLSYLRGFHRVFVNELPVVFKFPAALLPAAF